MFDAFTHHGTGGEGEFRMIVPVNHVMQDLRILGDMIHRGKRI